MSPILQQLIASIPAILTIILTGLVGTGLTFLWNLLLKRREFDLMAAKAFHDLYGEFFSVWKLWNYYVRDVGPEALSDASRWKLLERACVAEGRIEATLMELASNRHLMRRPSKISGIFDKSINSFARRSGITKRCSGIVPSMMHM
jgi:hypothetical protein